MRKMMILSAMKAGIEAKSENGVTRLTKEIIWKRKVAMSFMKTRIDNDVRSIYCYQYMWCCEFGEKLQERAVRKDLKSYLKKYFAYGGIYDFKSTNKSDYKVY